MHLRISTGKWVAVIVAALMLLSITSSVWAAPGQSQLRQTVPTRTPTKEVEVETPEPVTPEPATATPEPPKPTSKPNKPQPTQVPTEAAAQPTQAAVPTQGGAGDVAAQATATAAVIAGAGYPASGGDHTRVLLSGAVLVLLASGTVVIWWRRRARSAH
jgi:outer membrane biosynthesis protein TonB